MWEQPRVPPEFSHWTFHTLGATGTLEAPWGQRRQWRDSGWPSSVQTKPHCSVKSTAMTSGHPTGEGPVFTVSVAPFWSKTLRLCSRTPDAFPSPRHPLPAVDPGQRGSSYLDHPPRCQGGGHRVPGGRGVGSEPSWPHVLKVTVPAAGSACEEASGCRPGSI